MRWLLLIAVLGCSSGSKPDEVAAVPAKAADAPSVSPTTAMPKVYLTTPQGDLAVSVELARTPSQIQRGLMFREHLPPDQGMLFVMDHDEVHTFWMSNTLIPLDMIFIANDLTIAGIVANAAPRTEDLRAVGKPSRYVLEVNGGYCAAHQVAAGSKVRFENVPPLPRE